MGAVTRSALAAALAITAPPASGQAVDPVLRWRAHITEASLRFGVPQRWIERVMRAESGGWTALNGHPTRSRAGAIGLMQLMPKTWGAMRAWLDLGDNPDDPRDNIIAGTAYLRLLYDRFGYPGLFAAYNAGPTRYAAFLRGERRLPGETLAYLGQVATTPRASGLTVSRPETDGIFAPLGGDNSVARGDTAARSALFVPLRTTEPTR